MQLKTKQIMKSKHGKEIGNKIRSHFFNRNQIWLAAETGMSESELSKKMNGKKEWTQDDLDKINKVLGEKFKL